MTSSTEASTGSAVRIHDQPRHPRARSGAPAHPLGLLSKQGYRQSWEWKLRWFADNGFVLGENLFTTEDDPAGGLSQDSITEVAQRIEREL